MTLFLLATFPSYAVLELAEGSGFMWRKTEGKPDYSAVLFCSTLFSCLILHVIPYTFPNTYIINLCLSDLVPCYSVLAPNSFPFILSPPIQK